MNANDALAGRFARVRAAFHDLIEMEYSQRDAALAELARTDSALADEVRALILHTDEADLVAQQEQGPPLQIGPFRLLRRLGRGGMGEVWLAERADGAFAQAVALKRVRDGVLSPDLARRFVRERQILARLQHPQIAHLVDGGVGSDGRPWLAMEYVDGERIDDWCATHRLTVEQRVRLFVGVCDAVSFAHRNLVVHRDLKPANILVDAEGRPRLLDFGIARLLDPQHTDRTQTITAMTPAYAAPEQREGGDITTATDVYQLGAVLRELVGAAPDGASVLRGDLARILDKACESLPSARFAGVAMLAADLGDWVERRPLRSGLGSRRQRMRRMAWQWRWPLAMTVAVLLAVGTGVVLALREARAKAREAEVSRQTTQFMVSLFKGADPTVARGASLSAQDLLDQGNARLHGSTRLPSAVRARLLRTVADSYVALGHYERALETAQEALDLRRAEGDPGDIADSLDQVGNIFRLKAEYARAEALLREALSMRRAALPADDPAIIDSMTHLAALEGAQGDFRAADALFIEAAQSARRRFGDGAVETARQLEGYAVNLDDMGRRNEALTVYRQVLDIRERALGPDDPDVAATLLSLGVHLTDSGHYDEAVPLLERALAIRRAVFGEAHPLVAIAQIGLAGAHADKGRLDAAEDLATSAVESLKSALLPQHPKTTEALSMLALVRTLRRDYVGAIPLQRSVLATFEGTLGENHPDALTAKNNLAYALLHVGRAAEAEILLRDVIAHKRDDNGQASVQHIQNLANALMLQGKHAEAVTWQRRAVDVQQAREGPSSAVMAVALRELAIAKEVAGQDPEGDYKAALAVATRASRSHVVDLHPWAVALAAYLVGRQRCDEAVPLLQKADGADNANLGEQDAVAVGQRRLLFEACAMVGDARGREAFARSCQALRAMPGIEADVYPTTRHLLATHCPEQTAAR